MKSISTAKAFPFLILLTLIAYLGGYYHASVNHSEYLQNAAQILEGRP